MANTSDRANSDTQTIEELWESLERFSHNRVEDNKRSLEYPLKTRIDQMDALKSIVSAIEEFHNKFTV